MLLFGTAAPRPLGRDVFMPVVRIGQTVRSYRSMPDRFVSNIPAFDVGNGPRTASVGVILQEADLRARRSRGNDFHPHPAPCDAWFPSRAPGQRIIRHPVFVVNRLHTALPTEISLLRRTKPRSQYRLGIFYPLDSPLYRGLDVCAGIRGVLHSGQSPV